MKPFYQNQRFRKILRLFFLSLGIICILAIGAWFAFRNQVLQYVWQKAVNKLEQKGYVLSCEEKRFTGAFSASISDLQLRWKKDTLVRSAYVNSTVGIWESIWNGPTLSGLEMRDTKIQLVRRPGYCNFCDLQSSEAKEESIQPKEPLVQRAFDLLKRTISRIPENLTLQNFSVTYADSSDKFGLVIPKMLYMDNDIDGVLRIAENNHATGFNLKGVFNRNKMIGKLAVTPQRGTWVELPVLQRRFHTSAGFEAAEFELETLEMNSGVLHLVADGHFKGVTVNDKRIADTNVIIRDCEGKLVANFGADFLEIDSSSVLSLNKIKTNLYARADLGKEKSYTLKFLAKRIKSSDFFASLPQGMFSHLKGIKTTGELEYRLHVHIDDKAPYKAILESELKPYNFKITKMGETDLRKMNGSFLHTFYERGKPVRSFVIGPSNGRFTPLSSIPPALQKAVMTGEDPAFYNHNGFYAEAFRQSIAQNYVQKRFARGGSTISMQLVKNVFLSRKKTIARKIEEILIVWLIENQRLTSKARMFEVYLNAIEWGPGVFGIGEAAPFYFGKSASELQPLECIFLASIVPSPKSYRYFVDSAGYVSQRNWNFVAIRNNMLRKGDLAPADSASFNVKITGPAAKYLHLEPDEEEEEEERERPLIQILSPETKDKIRNIFKRKK